MVGICRDPSPITNNPAKREEKTMILEPNKIHRIILKSETLVTVSNVESPSRIWVKLRNHITPQLQYRKGHGLERLEAAPKVMDYVMAPFKILDETADSDELVHSRARVLKLSRDLILVHYIDEGFQQWLSPNCLAKMEEELFTHPWQAIPVCLFRLSPASGEWQQAHTTLLRNILDQYSLFRIKPVLCRPQNNYAFYSRVHMYGLKEEEDEDPLQQGQCVIRQLYMRSRLAPRVINGDFGSRRMAPLSVFLGLHMFDAAQQGVYETNGLDNEPEPSGSMEPHLKSWPDGFNLKESSIVEDDDKEISVEEELEARVDEDDDDEARADMKALILAERKEKADRKWDPGHYEVASPPFTRKSKLEPGREISFCADWRSMDSPDEFFVFPLEGTADAKHDPMYALLEKRDKWQLVLDDFYGQPENRRLIRSALVKSTLADGSKVYGITEIYDERSEMGHFHRAEVIAVRTDDGSADEFCKVRLIDSGGHKIVPMACVLRIHSTHCSMEPLCAQVKMNLTERPERWDDDHCREFKRLVRCDMPIRSTVVRQNPYRGETPYKTLPQDWPGAFVVQNLVLSGSGDNHTIEELFLEFLGKRARQSRA